MEDMMESHEAMSRELANLKNKLRWVVGTNTSCTYVRDVHFPMHLHGMVLK
jgi:hypothetical protein